MMISVVGIVGMGLIGGSMAKSAKFGAGKTVFGFDINNDVLEKAINEGVIDEVLSCDNLGKCDIVFLCLYPKQIVQYVKDNIGYFKKGSIISDVCGVKEYIGNEISALCSENNLAYIGTHPMAGKEVGGYENSDKLLFKKASMIIATATKDEKSSEMEDMFIKMGFSKVCYADQRKHDEIIAYTSQLAHI
ncbi:MAG: prephenate dehydrogenase/arogenate dehydrogenase family protein, partial [Oscillospiraceae bacterium]